MDSFTPPLSANIAQLEPYKSGRSLLKGGEYVFMDAGESPFVPAYDRSGLPDINRYPDPTADVLRDEIANLYGVERQQIITTCGIDELIDLFIKAFVRSERSILTFSPTFPMFFFAAQVNNKRYISVQLRPDFSLDINALKTQWCEADILILCTPNNPTGTTIELSDIREILGSFPGLVVVDEAYGEYAKEMGMPSAIDLIRQGAENLLVCRTFSKAYRAAGIRLGYGIASEKIIAALQKTKLPYNVNTLTQSIGIELLRDQKGMQQNVRTLQKESVRVQEECRNLGCDVSKSITHFFLLAPPPNVETRMVYEKLRDTFAIAVRPYGVINGKESLRINVGTPDQNTNFLLALSTILSS